LDDDFDGVYQEEELSSSFIVDPGAGLNDLVGDVDDIQMSVKQKQKPIKKKVWLPRLKARIPHSDADQFWNQVQVLFLFTTSFILYFFFANIVLTTYSLKRDAKTPV
jgi:hypothetical protein